MSESWKNRLWSLLLVCTFAVFFYGCGYKTIVLDAGDDKKEILLVGDTGFTSLSDMQIDAVEKAKNICEQDGKKYQFIQEGEKIKYTYLKVPNPTTDNVIAMLNTFPKEFELEKYIDYDLQFTKSFLDPLKIILGTIGWETEKKSTLESFFG